MKDLELGPDLALDSKGAKVRLIQEWLCLHGAGLAIDGDFGPVTERTVRWFQRRKRLPVTGMVEERTFRRLVRPMEEVLHPVRPGRRSLSTTVVTHALVHLRQHPREVGGPNRGPWVRLYMRGHQGPDWPWCAGFVSFLLGQAAYTRGVKRPYRHTFWVPDFAAEARARGSFRRGTGIESPSAVPPGTVFLVRKKKGWTHAGIVLEAHADGTCDTVEGNTNDEGSSEGYEVCRRTRAVRRLDFALVPDQAA